MTARMGVAPGARRAVTVLVSRQLRGGQVAGFTAAMEAMLAAARDFSGYLGGQLILPNEATGDGLAHAVIAFEDDACLALWHDSPERARCVEALAPFVLGSSQLSRLPRFEHWFVPHGAAQPPRWKVALLTWIGICPTVVLLTLAVGPLLSGWPLLPRMMVTSAMSVVVMVWVIAPSLNRWLGPWLYGQELGG